MTNCDCGACCNQCGHDPGCTSLGGGYRMDDAEIAAATDGVWLPRQQDRGAA